MITPSDSFNASSVSQPPRLGSVPGGIGVGLEGGSAVAPREGELSRLGTESGEV